MHLNMIFLLVHSFLPSTCHTILPLLYLDVTYFIAPQFFSGLQTNSQWKLFMFAPKILYSSFIHKTVPWESLPKNYITKINTNIWHCKYLYTYLQVMNNTPTETEWSHNMFFIRGAILFDYASTVLKISTQPSHCHFIVKHKNIEWVQPTHHSTTAQHCSTSGRLWVSTAPQMSLVPSFIK